jgi:hypothetical protein
MFLLPDWLRDAIILLRKFQADDYAAYALDNDKEALICRLKLEYIESECIRSHACVDFVALVHDKSSFPWKHNVE